MCAQSHALGSCTKLQLEILIINVISDIVYFREIILDSSQNVCETTPWITCLIFKPDYSEQQTGNTSTMAHIGCTETEKVAMTTALLSLEALKAVICPFY